MEYFRRFTAILICSTLVVASSGVAGYQAMAQIVISAPSVSGTVAPMAVPASGSPVFNADIPNASHGIALNLEPFLPLPLGLQASRLGLKAGRVLPGQAGPLPASLGLRTALDRSAGSVFRPVSVLSRLSFSGTALLKRSRARRAGEAPAALLRIVFDGARLREPLEAPLVVNAAPSLRASFASRLHRTAFRPSGLGVNSKSSVPAPTVKSRQRPTGWLSKSYETTLKRSIGLGFIAGLMGFVGLLYLSGNFSGLPFQLLRVGGGLSLVAGTVAGTLLGVRMGRDSIETVVRRYLSRLMEIPGVTGVGITKNARGRKAILVSFKTQWDLDSAVSVLPGSIDRYDVIPEAGGNWVARSEKRTGRRLVGLLAVVIPIVFLGSVLDLPVPELLAFSFTPKMLGQLVVVLLAAFGIGLFIYNMAQARRGWRMGRRIERNFEAIRNAQIVKDEIEQDLLSLPGAEIVYLQKFEDGKWGLVVYFGSEEDMDKAQLSSENVKGVPIKKDVWSEETVGRLIGQMERSLRRR